jgi:hypothetical protein
MLPFASRLGGPSDAELLALFLAVLVGAVFLIATVAVLLVWAGGRRQPRLPEVTPLDEKVGEMWARQLQMPQPFTHRHRHAA